MGVSTPQRTARKSAEDFRSPRSRTRRERTFAGVLLAATVVSVIVLAILLIDIFTDGLTRLRLDFFTNYFSRFADQTGVRSGIVGTFSLMVNVALFSFPIGVGAAIYLEEFAPDNRFTRLLETNIANLAGVPSVVYGLLGLGIFVSIFGFGRSLIAGALTLSLLILPVIIVASREALRAIPKSIRDGGLALGATPLQVIRGQILPAALPGMLTGTILALSRAIGETAPILVVGAIFENRTDTWPWEWGQAFVALPVQIFEAVAFPQEEFQIRVASAAIIVLLFLLLLMNASAIYLRNKYSKEL